MKLVPRPKAADAAASAAVVAVAAAAVVAAASAAAAVAAADVINSRHQQTPGKSRALPGGMVQKNPRPHGRGFFISQPQCPPSCCPRWRAVLGAPAPAP